MIRHYLETTVFTYLVLDSGEKGEQASAILEAMQAGKFMGVTSFITFEEIVFVVWKNKGREDALKAGRNFLRLNNLEIINATRDIANLTLEAMEKNRLMPRDATHYATAKEYGLPAMVTEDRDFNKAKEIKKLKMKEFLEKLG